MEANFIQSDSIQLTPKLLDLGETAGKQQTLGKIRYTERTKFPGKKIRDPDFKKY